MIITQSTGGMNQEEFIKKFNNTYGTYGYDLTKLNYVNTNIPVIISCKSHGDFKVTPYTLFKNDLHICSKCRKEQLNIRVVDTSTFIKKANILHNNKYNYDFTEYRGNNNEVIIKCLQHGNFTLTADKHLSRLVGCSSCSKENKKLNKRDIMRRFELAHGNVYSYPEFNNDTIFDYIKIICPKHGEFSQKIELHLKGHGCTKCANESGRLTKEKFIKKAQEIYGNKYDYSKVNYINNTTPITITCKKHGDFQLKPAYHLYNSECKICSKERYNSVYLDKFKKKANEIHNSKYNYSKSTYEASFKSTTIICPTHGEFQQVINDHLQGCGCPSCASELLNYSSSYELELLNFIKEHNPHIGYIERYKLKNKEIDLYFPEHKIGFEINGDYWHSHLFKEKTYHRNKSLFFESEGIKVYHIWEHDWVNVIKKEIIKSMVLNRLKLNKIKIYARKCKIKEVLGKEYKQFMIENHIQGYSPATIKLGLYFEDKLVACMSFSNLRVNMGGKNKDKSEWELVRYCTLKNTNIIGGASKLLKYFEINYKPKSVISYADNDYSDGNLYKQLGFESKGFTNLSYIYYNPKDRTVKNRFVYRKSELIKMGYDKTKTEFEITHSMGLYRIFNSGILKFQKYLES